jgi:osmoprotectant transport system ATP-binding protein
LFSGIAVLTFLDMNKLAIAFDHVTKSFGDRRIVAVNGASLQIAEGEFLTIVGGSGSGKTTLLRMANRLIDPDSGTITIHGQNTQGGDPIALRRSIGYVSQSAALFPHMSVAQNIGITPRLLNHPAAQISDRVDELMDMVQLDCAQYRDRMPGELSGGQRQRVGLARALAAKTNIVLMDEPFGALDPITRDTLGNDYKSLHKKLSLTTVMITHDMAEALLLADRVAVMHSGKIIAQGNAAELERSDDPYVRELLRTPRRQAEQLQSLLSGTTP